MASPGSPTPSVLAPLELNMNSTETDSSNSKASLVWVLIMGLAMLLLFWVATKWLFYSQPELTDEEAARSLERAEILQKSNLQADTELNQYAWKDRGAGVVQIPVQRAMDLEIATLNTNREVRPAYPVDPLAAAAAVQSPPPPTAENTLDPENSAGQSETPVDTMLEGSRLEASDPEPAETKALNPTTTN